jgi:hypothetical protein
LGNKYLSQTSSTDTDYQFSDYDATLSTFIFDGNDGVIKDCSYNYVAITRDASKNYNLSVEASSTATTTTTTCIIKLYANNGGTVTTPEVPETPEETEVVIGSTAGEVTLIADAENSGTGFSEYAMPVNNAQFTINGQAYTVVPETKVEYGVVYDTFAQVASGSQGAEGASEINGRMALIMDGGEPQFAVVIPESDIVTISGEGENDALVAVPEIYSESESDSRTEISILGSDKFPAMLEKAVMNTRKVNFTTNEGNDYDVSLYANISADENTDEIFADGDEYTLNNIPADAKTITVETVYLYDEMELILDKTEYTITDAKAPTCTGIEISDAKLVYGEDADNTTGTTPLDLSFTLKLNWDDESNLDGYYMGFTVETDFNDDQQGHESSYNFEIDGYTELEEGDSWTSANSWATMGLTSDIKVTLKHALCVDWTNAEDHLNISEKVKDLNLKVNYEVARYVANKNTAAAAPRRDISLYSDNSEYTISKESLVEPTEETKSLSDSDVDINTITGIESIMIDANDGSEYYNLQGVRIPTDNLVPGIYIHRNGSNASKIVVR